jgi:hypothetical protein
MEAHHSVLLAFAGKLSSQTTIVVGVDGRIKLETSLLPSLVISKLNFYV